MNHQTSRENTLFVNSQSGICHTEDELTSLRRQLSRAEAQRAAQAHRNRVRTITTPLQSEGTTSAQAILRNVPLAGDPLLLNPDRPPQLHRVDTDTLPDNRAMHIAGNVEQSRAKSGHRSTHQQRDREQLQRQQRQDNQALAWIVTGLYAGALAILVAIVWAVR